MAVREGAPGRIDSLFGEGAREMAQPAVSGHSYPALEAWQRELREGKRTRATYDALWRAACTEANAREFESIPGLHQRLMSDARKIIKQALREQNR